MEGLQFGDLSNEDIWDTMITASFQDTLRFCQLSRRYHEVCQQPVFWKKKALYYFGETGEGKLQYIEGPLYFLAANVGFLVRYLSNINKKLDEMINIERKNNKDPSTSPKIQELQNEAVEYQKKADEISFRIAERLRELYPNSFRYQSIKATPQRLHSLKSNRLPKDIDYKPEDLIVFTAHGSGRYIVSISYNPPHNRIIVYNNYASGLPDEDPKLYQDRYEVPKGVNVPPAFFADMSSLGLTPAAVQKLYGLPFVPRGEGLNY